jgi:hypothetical protein
MTSYDTRPLTTAGALDDDDDDDDDVAAGDGRGNWGAAADSASPLSVLAAASFSLDILPLASSSFLRYERHSP